LALAATVQVAPSAAAQGPAWKLTSVASPTVFAPGDSEDVIVLTAVNVGEASTDGSQVTLGDSLPAESGLTAAAISGYDAYASGIAVNGSGSAEMSCSPIPALSCTYPGKVDPGDTLVVTITLKVGTTPTASASNEATVSGGGAQSSSATSLVTTGQTPSGFGPARGSVVAATSTNQAGAHANVTTAFALQTSRLDGPPFNPKDIRFDLPPGLVGSIVGLPQCTMQHVVRESEEPKACASDTMVGMATVTLNESLHGEPFSISFPSPVFNIAPAPGEPAAFAFNAQALPVRLDTQVLSNGNYAVRVTAQDTSEVARLLSASITVWGVPADHSGPGQDKSLFNLISGEGSFGGPNSGQTRVALLTNPQQCTEALSATMSTDSWANPGMFVSSGPVPMGTLAGCDRLSFASSLRTLPDTLNAGAPAGYDLEVNVPQDTSPDGLAAPNIKKVELTLPAGTVLSPSSASGLTACSNMQFFGARRGDQEPATPAECPPGAQIGTVEVKTPALPLPLQGQLYLAEPECSPCSPEHAENGKMLRLFLQVVGEGGAGIVVKVEGRSRIDQRTGQITTTFENSPQLPFNELIVKLNGGPRAPLANPRSCGPIASNLDLTPWSAPFTSDSTPSYGFEVNQGCFGPQFTPSFVAGTTNIQARAYTPFTLSFGRTDHDQLLSGLEMRMPAGLLGKLSVVTACKEPQAAQGACGPESLIGHVQALVGAGTTPYLVGGGQVFLTEGYKGAPFGLSIVVPAVAGPYTLAGTTGHGTVVVRASISVDQHTSALTIKSDPLPTALDGIPLQVKAVKVTIDRDEFMFNPTNCSRLAIAGTLSNSEGASAAVSSPFEVANCATLPFKPAFTALTQAKTSKANGASLRVKVASGAGQANIGKVKVDLPKQLPSRLTTLQKACSDATFNSNPASCPSGSLVGTATAVTPVLKTPLTGPAYLVSHAGAAFPDLVIVLQGEGITLDLVGNTDIKKGITISTFNSVPDAPVSTFDLVLPEGPHSALGANLPLKAKESLCKQSLAMPTLITGQNGAVIRQTTKIAVSGCPKRKHAKRAAARRRRSGKT
jgi:hypothetical protein